MRGLCSVGGPGPASEGHHGRGGARSEPAPTATAYGDDPTLSTPDDPTTRFTYTTTSTPNSVKVEAREDHGGTATYQESYAYLDGSGAVVQTKSQVAPGDAPQIVSGSVVWSNATSRWVGSGRIIVDNKGNIVRKYEPFFSHTSDFEDEKDIAEWGVSPVFSYDPIGRNTKVTLPDDNFRTFLYSPWEVQAFDECDNEASGLHENTPTITHLDAMGRVVEVWELLDTDWLDSRENSNPSLRLDPTADDGVLRTRVEFDVSGNPKVVTDPRNNDIQVQTHDLLGRALFTGSADEGYGTTSGHGESRIAPDADGQAFQSWRSGGLFFEVDFDALRRPTHRRFNDGSTTRLVEYRVYGEESGAPDFARGRPWKVYDTAGLHEFSEYDFKGNSIGEERTVVDDLRADVDWTDIDNSSQTATVLAAVLGSSPTAHTLSRTFDALGRQLTETAPDGSVTTYSYDEGNRLVTVEVAIGGGSTTTPMVDGITYNARGQRLTVIQGDSSGTHATTTYTYDVDRFWVTDIETQRSSDSTSQLLQALSYTRDPCGNITQVTDGAHEDHFFDNTQVTPTRTFLYDALYRLIEATGREKTSRASQTWGLPSKGGVPDGGAASTVLEEYTEEYKYDKAGNITELKHIPSTSATWTRTYSYASGNNQLQSTSEPASGGGTRNDSYDYNERGAMVFLPHLDTSSGTDNVVRDFRDHIRRVTIDTSGNKAWYAYDAGGQRIGKHVESPDTRIRLYLWGYELYREYNSSDAVIEEWEVLHVMDDQRRVALVETQTVGGTKQFLRFQFSDHLGTAAVECDGLVSMGVVSYEEFHPYGTVAWYAEKSGVDLNPKRYRFTGMERDDETGMQYHSQRYYLPWLGRWERVDPIGLGDGGNRFAYLSGRPTIQTDNSGLGAPAVAPTPPSVVPPRPLPVPANRPPLSPGRISSGGALILLEVGSAVLTEILDAHEALTSQGFEFQSLSQGYKKKHEPVVIESAKSEPFIVRLESLPTAASQKNRPEPDGPLLPPARRYEGGTEWTQRGNGAWEVTASESGGPGIGTLEGEVTQGTTAGADASEGGALPANPADLLDQGYEDTTPDGMRENTDSREFTNHETGDRVRYDPGKEGATGWEGKDHYHRYNPYSTGKGDQYLDADGNPTPRGSKSSHLTPRGF